MKMIKINNIKAIISRTTNKMLLEGKIVHSNSYYLRMVSLYTEVNNNILYVAVEDDYLKNIKKGDVKWTLKNLIII